MVRPNETAKGKPKATANVFTRRLDIGSDTEIAKRMIGLLQSQNGPIVNTEGAFWRFIETHWQTIDEHQLHSTIQSFDEHKTRTGRHVMLSSSRVRSIEKCMRPYLTRDQFFSAAPRGINCMSGFIRFDNRGVPSITKHHRDYACRHVLPGYWPARAGNDAEAGSLLTKLLHGCFPDDPDAVHLISELAGAAALGIATDLTAPKAIVFVGESAENGKSQVMDLIRALLPPEAVSSISPARFSEGPYLARLAGKHLNTVDELSTTAISSDQFKQVITGEPITARDMYAQAFEFRPTALHIFATNRLPSFRGGIDRGVQRRLLLLPFDRTIPPAERIPHLGRRVGKEEPDLLLAFAVNGASRLIANGGFTELPSSRRALRDWIGLADPVLAAR